INDEDGLWAGALRLPTFQAGRRQFLKRMTIIIRGGRIEGVTYPVHPPDTHASELLRTLR
ncbi:MAG: peroxiredoxin, partial [Pseudomonadota bacterium]